jgi:hypothetical protein
MSAIDFRTSVKRKADPKGDRVVITMDGKVSRPRDRFAAVESLTYWVLVVLAVFAYGRG